MNQLKLHAMIMEKRRLSEEKARHYREEGLRNLPLLIDTACTDSGGGRACRRILLACYNYTNFPLDLSELATLDDDHFSAAMAVIAMVSRAMDMEIHHRIPEAEHLFRAWAAAEHKRRSKR